MIKIPVGWLKIIRRHTNSAKECEKFLAFLNKTGHNRFTIDVSKANKLSKTSQFFCRIHSSALFWLTGMAMNWIIWRIFGKLVLFLSSLKAIEPTQCTQENVNCNTATHSVESWVTTTIISLVLVMTVVMVMAMLVLMLLMIFYIYSNLSEIVHSWNSFHSKSSSDFQPFHGSKATR